MSLTDAHHVFRCLCLFTTKNGVEIQAYMAIIACLLILIYTGRTPTKRTFEMICLYLQGWAELDELEAHIVRLKKTVSLPWTCPRFFA